MNQTECASDDGDETELVFDTRVFRRPICVAIATDQANLRGRLAAGLVECGHDVIEVSSPRELRRLVRRPLAGGSDSRPDMVICDAHMDGMRDLDVIEVLGTASWFTRVVLLERETDFLTARARKLRGVAVYRRDVDPERLWAAVSQMVP